MLLHRARIHATEDLKLPKSLEGVRLGCQPRRGARDWKTLPRDQISKRRSQPADNFYHKQMYFMLLAFASVLRWLALRPDQELSNEILLSSIVDSLSDLKTIWTI
jgi:hypothetical protein